MRHYGLRIAVADPPNEQRAAQCCNTDTALTDVAYEGGSMAKTEVTTPARVAIYARVSTNEQSPELQLRDLTQYTTARGLSATEYVDAGFSGAKQSRPALDQLMDDARKRRFDCVIVWRFDRFARSTKHLLLALEEFRSWDSVHFLPGEYRHHISTWTGAVHDCLRGRAT